MVVTYDVTVCGTDAGGVFFSGDARGNADRLNLTAPSVVIETRISEKIRCNEILYRVLMTLFRRHSLATTLVLHNVTTCIQRMVTTTASLSGLIAPSDDLVGTPFSP